jgi:hypothetical protein
VKKLLYLVLAACVVSTSVFTTSCSDGETYAEKKKKEERAIGQFLLDNDFVGKINAITEEQFYAQDSMTDLSKNEFVKFNSDGIYMQIVRKGVGQKLAENKSTNILCRFLEKNIQLDSVLLRNDIQAWLTYNGNTYDTSLYVDKMSVVRTGNTITASFITGMMYMYHGSASVPAGWLVPLNYVKIGRPDAALAGDQEIAKVHLIVPHSQGTSDASASVYPCYYEITYQISR